MTAQDYIRELNLQPHPEGGYFSEWYRSEGSFIPEGFGSARSFGTSIYFLLENGNFSALHRIKSDELWHFYDGDPLEIIEISPNGKPSTTILGRCPEKDGKLTHLVKAGQWFGSRLAPESRFALVGCTVSPGFDFRDFEMPHREWFLSEFPSLEGLIGDMTR